MKNSKWQQCCSLGMSKGCITINSAINDENLNQTNEKEKTGPVSLGGISEAKPQVLAPEWCWK